MIGLVADLAVFVPPARVFDKHVYSPWTGSDLHQQLRHAGIDTVIITGGETDVCVVSTMLGAIDWGFRTILIQDALCSSTDETHDAMMNVYMSRFSEQVETITTETLLESWLVERQRKNVMDSGPPHLVQVLFPKGTAKAQPIRKDGLRLPCRISRPQNELSAPYAGNQYLYRGVFGLGDREAPDK
jgi:hypothetical protein